MTLLDNPMPWLVDQLPGIAWAILIRLSQVCYAALVLLDCTVCLCWLAPLYLFGLASRPTGQQMISAYVGRAAINGHRWAARAALAIDFLFFMKPNHCRRMARQYAGFAD